MDGAALERRHGVLDEAAFVQRVGVNGDLDVHVVGHRQRAIDGGGRRPPILMQLEPASTGLDLFDEPLRLAGIALAEEAEIHWKGFGCLKHPLHMPGPWRAGRGGGARRRAGAAAHHRGDAGKQRFLDLLRADEMDMHVDAARSDDLALARDRLRARPDDNVDARLHIRIARLADGGDAPVLDADIGLDDPPMIQDQRVGDDGIDRTLAPRRLALAHAVADHLAAAELHLLAVDGAVLLDLDDEVGVGEAHPVADRGAIHSGISGAGDFHRHGCSFYLVFSIAARAWRIASSNVCSSCGLSPRHPATTASAQSR